MNKDQTSFFFFDYETWGVSPSKDRPTQFAGIRTDSDLNIIDDPIVLFCKPPTDYLPNPEAALITGITPQYAAEHGLTEPAFIQQIIAQLSKPNTVSVGYNNIRFDDEVTRYTCYRNFMDPYEWSYKNGNSRWDIIDLMRACYALRPNGLQWPTNADGYISFKLEDLAKANGIEHTQAHDALSDVFATIGLAKLVKHTHPKLFAYYLRLRDKNAVKREIQLTPVKPVIHVSGMFGHQACYTSQVLPMAWHPTNTNAIICIDLAKDPSVLFDLTIEQIKQRLYTKHSELSEDELPIPLKLIHTNKSPFIAPLNVVNTEIANSIGLNTQICAEHLAFISSHIEFKQLAHKLEHVFTLSEEDAQQRDAKIEVDGALYQGFFSQSDKQQMAQLRRLDPMQLSTFTFSSQDKRLPALLFHYRARNYFHTLTDKENQQWRQHCLDYFERQLPDYLRNLEVLLSEHNTNEKQWNILKAVHDYVVKLTS